MPSFRAAQWNKFPQDFGHTLCCIVHIVLVMGRCPFWLLCVLMARSHVLLHLLLQVSLRALSGWIFSMFKDENEVVKNVQTYMVDYDLTEIKGLKSVFPGTKVELCLFHCLKKHEREEKFPPAQVNDSIRKCCTKECSAGSEEKQDLSAMHPLSWGWAITNSGLAVGQTQNSSMSGGSDQWVLCSSMHWFINIIVTSHEHYFGSILLIVCGFKSG